MLSAVNFYRNYVNPLYFKAQTAKGGDADNKTLSPSKPTQASIFYINDLHGNIGNMSRIYNAKKSFDKLNQEGKDIFCLAAGDISASDNDALVKISSTFMDSINLDANVIGNHELDANPEQIYDINKDYSYTLLGALNMRYKTQNNPLESIVAKSYVKEINGNKYGIIGIIPPDLHGRIRDNDSKKTIFPLPEAETAAAVQEEVKKLQEKGINKIILLSHCGLKFDQNIAQNTNGIDIILGAHTHNLIKDVKANENLFNSTTGEPVIITQAGKDGEHFGVLNVEFDENGVIKSVQNNVQNAKDFNRNPVMEEIFNTILDKKEVVGYVKTAMPPLKDRLAAPNPNGYIIADACRSELNTDIALVNSGNIRGDFKEGVLTERKLYEITPLNNKMLELRINEEELVNAVKVGADSICHVGHRAGLIIPSGFVYTLTRSGELKSLTIIDKNGNKREVNINNPDKNKIYTVATDSFMACGGDNYLPNKLEEIDANYDFDKDKLAADYIKKIGKPVEIVDDGRIQFVD